VSLNGPTARDKHSQDKNSNHRVYPRSFFAHIGFGSAGSRPDRNLDGAGDCVSSILFLFVAQRRVSGSTRDALRASSQQAYQRRQSQHRRDHSEGQRVIRLHVVELLGHLALPRTAPRSIDSPGGGSTHTLSTRLSPDRGTPVSFLPDHQLQDVRSLARPAPSGCHFISALR